MQEEKMKYEEVIVVGAGPSGLAVAACLGLNSIPYILLERDDCYAPIWKKRSYDRLHLHLPKQICELPHMPFPLKTPTYVSKKEFVQYLDEYVSCFEISPLYERLVELVQFDEESKLWHVKARRVDEEGVFEEFRRKYLVVASDENSNAFVPEVEGLENFEGDVLHSTQYKNGKEFENKNVLVVGSGNSGMEIALDLSNFSAKTSIVVRSPGNDICRRSSIPLPSFPPCGLIYGGAGDLSNYGITRPEETPLLMTEKYGKYLVIDVGNIKKIKSSEIQVLPPIKRVDRSQVEFENGKSHSFDAMIFATGFKRSTSLWLKGDDYLLKEDGLTKPHLPDRWKGEKGLYCSGLSRKGFAGICSDAKKIANDIKKSLNI